ncbi:MAG: hypothetical protein H6566_28655 [Lewinellaceae bacterium]|nr:hypothetical protein [Lewinellaceae bacterium]
MRSLMILSRLSFFFISFFMLTACPNPEPEEVRVQLTPEQYDSLLRADVPTPRIRRQKEQLQSQGDEWD